jgi:hypothetical protein
MLCSQNGVLARDLLMRLQGDGQSKAAGMDDSEAAKTLLNHLQKLQQQQQQQQLWSGQYQGQHAAAGLNRPHTYGQPPFGAPPQNTSGQYQGQHPAAGFNRPHAYGQPPFGAPPQNTAGVRPGIFGRDQGGAGGYGGGDRLDDDRNDRNVGEDDRTVCFAGIDLGVRRENLNDLFSKFNRCVASSPVVLCFC